MSRFRCICFTLHNYTKTNRNEIKNCNLYDYLIMGEELGKEGKTPHIQGYMELKTQLCLNTIKKRIGIRTLHIEKRYGTQKQAIEYCKKEGKWREFGTPKQQGKRTDILKYREMIKKKTMREILNIEDEVPNSQIIKFCEKYLTLCEEKRDWKPEVIWIHGESGSGKTRLAHLLSKSDDKYIKDETQWWDGYDKHDTIILDDFRAKQMNFTYLLKLLDRYEMRLQVKGGFRQCLAKKIIITSIHKPEVIYNFSNKEEPLKQLFRRIDKIVDISEAGNHFDNINFQKWEFDS